MGKSTVDWLNQPENPRMPFSFLRLVLTSSGRIPVIELQASDRSSELAESAPPLTGVESGYLQIYNQTYTHVPNYSYYHLGEDLCGRCQPKGETMKLCFIGTEKGVSG